MIQSISRRQFLRGVGVSLAIPVMESFCIGKAIESPRRYAFIYTPNGYLQRNILPSHMKSGRQDVTITPTLEPLQSIREELTFITGLDRVFVPGTGVHAQAGSCWLTSSAPQETLDAGFPTNTTLDQVIAQKIGQETILPSLELSANDYTDNKETKYFECISWYGPGHAASTEKNPRAVFQRLFGQHKDGPSKSVLDAVLSDAKQLEAKLSAADRRKVGEYLDSVRAVERRINRASQSLRNGIDPTLAQPIGIPSNRSEYLRLMADLMVFSFQSDLTRVATLLVDPERWDNPRLYDGVFETPQNHHVLTHTKGEEAKDMLAKIDRFHIEFYGYVVERLKAAQLLESTTLVMGSGISDGDIHQYGNLEVLVSGGGWKRGHFHFEGNRPLADLWLTICRDAGVARERFADSEGLIQEIVS